MSLIDEARISVSAGTGGSGKVSFSRTRSDPRGGPDGGNGGVGGSVYAVASPRAKTLRQYRRQFRVSAENGVRGGNRRRRGASATDVVLEVPVGTVIRDLDSGMLHADLTSEGMRTLLARGGRGGVGNTHFKSSTNRRPRESTDGCPGERREFLLELRILAEIGMVGLPNAGKSSLLAALTAANPKVANYPFTTLEPNLGVIADDRSEHVVADIPGLIEGAAKGAGLGNRFLRHVSRTRLLWHVVDIATPEDMGQLRRNIELLVSELSVFEGGYLSRKPCWLILNKADIADGARKGRLPGALGACARGMPTFLVSAVTGEGIDRLRWAALNCDRAAS